MKTLTKLIMVGILLGTFRLAELARIAYAAQPKMPTAILPEHRGGNQIAQASTALPVRDRETNDDAKELAEDQQESAKLQSLAKITPQQAQQAAEGTQGGQARSVKIESDDGNLVYAVVIGQNEVKVDAGNGRILYSEVLDYEDKKTDASRPRSSIQVPETPGSDRDG